MLYNQSLTWSWTHSILPLLCHIIVQKLIIPHFRAAFLQFDTSSTPKWQTLFKNNFCVRTKKALNAVMLPNIFTHFYLTCSQAEKSTLSNLLKRYLTWLVQIVKEKTTFQGGYYKEVFRTQGSWFQPQEGSSVTKAVESLYAVWCPCNRKFFACSPSLGMQNHR